MRTYFKLCAASGLPLQASRRVCWMYNGTKELRKPLSKKSAGMLRYVYNVPQIFL